MNEADEFIVKRDILDSLKTKYRSLPNETVHEQSVRYGKLAYEAFCLKLIFQKDEDDYIDFFSFLKKNDNEFYSWDELPKNFQNVWIEVGAQIEQLTLSEQNEYILKQDQNE